MALNIKNERVHELARRAAAATGKTQTGAIEEALTRLLAAYGEDPSAAEASERIDRVRALLVEVDAERARTTPGAIARIEDLYDDRAGLPR